MRCAPFQIPTTYVGHPVRASRMFFSDVVDVGFRVYACMSFRCRLDVSVQGHLFFCDISRYERLSHHVISPYALWEFAWFLFAVFVRSSFVAPICNFVYVHRSQLGICVCGFFVVP